MQALLASEYAKGNYKQARTVLYRVLQVMTLFAIIMLKYLVFLSSNYKLMVYLLSCRLEV
jgi:Na+-driven multidrug efflux pump